jgi:hypothetical protein
MKNPTFAELTKLVPIVDRTEFAWLIRDVLRIHSAEALRAPVSLDHQLQIYSYEWFKHLGKFNVAQIRDLIEAMAQERLKFVKEAEKAWEFGDRANYVDFNIVVIDMRYVSWTGRTESALDTLTGQTISVCPEPAVTTIMLNVYSLIMQKWKWLERLHAPNSNSRTAPVC